MSRSRFYCTYKLNYYLSKIYIIYIYHIHIIFLKMNIEKKNYRSSKMKYIARDSREDLASFPATFVPIPAPPSQLQGGNLTSYSYSVKSVVDTIPFNNNFTHFTVKDIKISKDIKLVTDYTIVLSNSYYNELTLLSNKFTSTYFPKNNTRIYLVGDEYYDIISKSFKTVENNKFVFYYESNTRINYAFFDVIPS